MLVGCKTLTQQQTLYVLHYKYDQSIPMVKPVLTCAMCTNNTIQKFGNVRWANNVNHASDDKVIRLSILVK